MRDNAEQREEVSFTYRWYRKCLRQLREAGYSFQQFDGVPSDGDVLLRHDVDLSLESAVRMARIEADLDVQATDFMFVVSNLYNPFEPRQRERVRELHSLGHDVGLHFSTHGYWADEPPEI